MGFLGGGKRPGTDRQEVGRPGLDRSAADRVASADAELGFADRVVITLVGVRQPIVAILLLIAFFTVLSGKPLDGFLLSIVATALAWDAGMRTREASTEESGDDRRVPADGDDLGGLAQPSAWRLRAGRPALRLTALGMTLTVIYSIVVGSFTRYSWPATAGVAGLGAGVVIVGWGGPTRQRAIPGRFSRAGVTVWGSLFVVASLWELGALLGQPDFETGSYAHPTISTLTDPLLASSLGRSVALLGWIALGFFLVDR